jgi:hypothetical protein
MEIIVTIPDDKIQQMVKQRLVELFGDDARYRETSAREMVRAIVDESAVAAVRSAREKVEADLPVIAEVAVREAIKNDIMLAAKRGIGALKKLFVGFDPAKLTEDQRDWLTRQLTAAAKAKDASQ